MCGIAGCAGDFVVGLVARMNAAQAHRGPDDQGIFEDASAGVALGHVRLAILDLGPTGRQPMYSPDGRFVLVFNGEIYNFKELREELRARGYNFLSTGDTEVLLYGLQEYGKSFIERLNGMFAFGLWDRQERSLLLARDQLGIKPLYYAQPRPGTLIFASEIKALCAHPGLTREPDFEALQQHLAYCHASDERTALKGIKRVPPGHWLEWRKNVPMKIQRFWRPPFDPVRNGNREDGAAELQALVRHGVLRQLVSDVPVGALLSGGLDSSVITALAVGKADLDFRGYTITYPVADNRLDQSREDAPYARRLARSIGLRLQEIELNPVVAELWARLVWHLDEPISDPAAIACYLICKLAREHGTKVLLSGQGADELFCGYPRYRVMNMTGWMDGLPTHARHMISQAAQHLSGGNEGKSGAFQRRLRRSLTGLEQPLEERFLNYCANTPQTEITRILSQDFKAALKGRSFHDDCLEHMKSQGLNGLQRLRERDLSIYLPNHNLLYTDKMGMAVGVEPRVPLLDLDLVNRVAGYPDRWLVSKGKTKVLLREAARGVVPDEIIDRPKAGFGAPYRKWLRYDLAEMWGDLTSEEAVRARGWFDYNALQDARARSQAGKHDLYMLQWSVLTIELWARQFIDLNPSEIVWHG